MCSTWLPAVFGEITRRPAISLFDRPRAGEPRHRAGRRTVLGEVVPDVVPCRFGGDHGAPGNLLVREAAWEERGDLALPGCEPRRSFAPARDPMAGGAEHRFDGVCVE